MARLLDANEFTSLRPVLEGGAGGAADDAPRRDGFGEFFDHSGCCSLGVPRGPMPAPPPLSVALGVLRGTEAVASVLSHARSSDTSRLLYHSKLLEPSPQRAAHRPPPPPPPPPLLGVVTLSSPPEPPGHVLRDASGSIPLLLDEATAVDPSVLGSVWLLENYHLLAEPVPDAAPRLHVWTRLHQWTAWGTRHACTGQLELLLGSPDGHGPVHGRGRSDASATTWILVRHVARLLGAATTACPDKVVLEATVCLHPSPHGPPSEWSSWERAQIELEGGARAWAAVLQSGASSTLMADGEVWPRHSDDSLPSYRVKSCVVLASAGSARASAAEELHCPPASPAPPPPPPPPPPNPAQPLDILKLLADKGGIARLGSRLSVRGLLQSVSPKEGEGFTLCLADSESGEVCVDAHASGVRPPPGCLVGSGVVLSGALPRLSSSSHFYLSLDERSGIALQRAASADVAPAVQQGGGAGAGGAGVADGETAGGVGTQAQLAPPPSALAALSGCQDAMLARLPRGQGILRLQLTVLTVWDLHLAMRCHACGTRRDGRLCQCVGGGDDAPGGALFEAHATVKVTDGSGEAYLDLSGRLVWALLQCSSSVVEGVRAVTRVSGPLSAVHREVRRGDGFLLRVSAGLTSGGGHLFGRCAAEAQTTTTRSASAWAAACGGTAWSGQGPLLSLTLGSPPSTGSGPGPGRGAAAALRTASCGVGRGRAPRRKSRRWPTRATRPCRPGGCRPTSRRRPSGSWHAS
jgi:hypothetical protein